jgi:murein DD-endopeptidase MepM/ murein hydrolase activator NlpD
VLVTWITSRLVVLLLLAGVLVAGAAGASPSAPAPTVSASAFGITVVLPGQTGAAVAGVTAPGAAPAAALDGYVYPADGSAVRTGALSSSAFARANGKPTAQAVADVLSVSLFNGEITAEAVASRANASAAGATPNGAALTNLVALGQTIAATANQRIPLGDWGYAIALEQAVEASTANEVRNARVSVTALRVVLTADHGGLPAGSEILVGHTEAALAMPAVTPTTPGTATTVTTPSPKPARPAGVPPKTRKKLPKPPEPDTLPGKPGSIFRMPPLDVSAPLSPEGYVFPVYGPSSFTDTFRAPRAGVGWHHGEDIFAPLGAPLLAVADGTIFSVGWNDRGGYRLWLRDRQGNQFYYAHLSAFSPLAVDGNEVRAGNVIGFVGNTGDAQSTPYHLHFEIHPVGLLPLGYDGVVNAFPYLSAWRRLQDISFAAGRGWAPPVPANATAPHAAAFLLGSTDISTASGLDPGSLDRALTAPVSAEGDGALIRAG